MRVSQLLTVAAAAIAFTATPALAQSKAVTHEASEAIAGVKPAIFGKWALMPMTTEHCQAIGDFDGGIYLSMGESEKGDGRFVLIADRFSFTAGKSVPATISFDGWKTSKPYSFDPIQTGSGTWMIVTGTDAGFMRSLLAAKRVSVRVPSAQIDQNFDIPEAKDVIAEIHYCNQRMAAAAK